MVKITNVQNYRAHTLKIVLGFLEQYAILSKEGSASLFQRRVPAMQTVETLVCTVTKTTHVEQTARTTASVSVIGPVVQLM